MQLGRAPAWQRTSASKTALVASVLSASRTACSPAWNKTRHEQIDDQAVLGDDASAVVRSPSGRTSSRATREGDAGLKVRGRGRLDHFAVALTLQRGAADDDAHRPRQRTRSMRRRRARASPACNGRNASGHLAGRGSPPAASALRARLSRTPLVPRRERARSERSPLPARHPTGCVAGQVQSSTLANTSGVPTVPGAARHAIAGPRWRIGWLLRLEPGNPHQESRHQQPGSAPLPRCPASNRAPLSCVPLCHRPPSLGEGGRECRIGDHRILLRR